MSYSAVGLAGEVGERPGGAGELVVEPDAGGEREEFGGDAGSEAVQGSGVVAFEPELVFEGPEDRLDALADRGEMRAVSGLVSAAGSQHHGAVAFGDGGGELFAGVALVGDDRLAAAQADRQQAQRDVAFFWSAGARIAARGVPSGAASRCSRIPQNHRLWLRQYP